MTVKELIQKLQTFDEDLRIVTPGFDESNLDDVETVEKIRVVFHDIADIGHVGRHQHEDEEEVPLKEAMPAILIDF